MVWLTKMAHGAIQALCQAADELKNVMAVSTAQPHTPETKALAAEPVRVGLGVYDAIDTALQQPQPDQATEPVR